MESDVDPEAKAKRVQKAVTLRDGGDAEAALAILTELHEADPSDALVSYQLAWTLDKLDREDEAAMLYEQALDSRVLSDEDALGASIGLGSSYRNIGKTACAVRVFRQLSDRFPDDPGIAAFLALALHSDGKDEESISLLLKTLLRACSDDRLQEYKISLKAYADELDPS